MRTLVQILMAAAFLALMLSLRWGAYEIDLAWPRVGASVAYVVVLPLLLAGAYYLDRRDDGKAKDFWGTPEPAALEYDFDVTAESAHSRGLRLYAKVAAAALVLLWLYLAYDIMRQMW
jgi:hypothetical protein